MSVLMVINVLIFITLIGYALYLFTYLVYSRVTYIKLGRAADLKEDATRTLNAFWVNVFGQKKLMKDSKSGVM
ncbi:hypothetical protein NHB30_26665, partial [Aneurinibacillus migulanus]|nr:hypothetical protein [Aneurinibacillus migulanus]